MKVNYTSKAKEVIAECAEIQALAADKKKITVATALPVVLSAIEKKSLVQCMTSAEKQKLAEAVIKQLCAKDPKVQQASLLITTGVSLLNTLFGKKWLKK